MSFSLFFLTTTTEHDYVVLNLFLLDTYIQNVDNIDISIFNKQKVRDMIGHDEKVCSNEVKKFSFLIFFFTIVFD